MSSQAGTGASMAISLYRAYDAVDAWCQAAHTRHCEQAVPLAH